MNHNQNAAVRDGGFPALLTLLLASLLLLLAPALPHASAQVQLQVAVVDLERLWEESALSQALNEEMRTYQGEFRQQLEQINARGTQMLQELETLNPTNDRYRTLRRDVLALNAQFQSLQEVGNAELGQMMQAGNLRFVRAVREATARVAQERRIPLVFQKSRRLPENLGDPNAVRNLELLMAQQHILYSDPSVDITSDVLVRMNEMFRAGQLGPQRGNEAPPPLPITPPEGQTGGQAMPPPGAPGGAGEGN